MAEDYTTYTKVDPNNRFQLPSPNFIVFTGLTRNESAYIYKDFGVGYFSGDFSINVDVEYNSATGNFFAFPLSLSTAVGDWNTVRTGGGSSLGITGYSSNGTTKSITLQEAYGGSGYSATWDSMNLATPYYLTLRRVGSNLYCDIYSNSARTTLITTLTLALHSVVAYRYRYGFQSLNTGDSSSVATGYAMSPGAIASGSGGGGSPILGSSIIRGI